MNAVLAAACFGVAIALLVWLNRERRARVSKAVWIPLIWLLIASSRPVAEWFIGQQQSANYDDGTPLDRTILMVLLGLAIFTLSRRTPKVKAILQANIPIVLFFAYCLASIVWSDFPFVSFKRWIRGVADVAMILVIVTDPDWEAALKWLFTRIAFLLIPLSVLIIKFFPQYGRSYTASGAQMWTGVCTDKNALGMLCMIFGTAVLWQMLPASSLPNPQRIPRRELFAKGVVFAMTLYLIWLIDSKTALICFVFANGLIILTWLSTYFRNRVVLTAMTVGMVVACYCVLFLGIGSSALTQIGRNSDLTGRREIWATVLPLAPNPLLGAGYEDFWMGRRVEAVARNLVRLNQAHNGYLETYLNLGWIGLILLGAIIVTGYRNLMRGLRSNFQITRLKLIFFTLCLVYNFTEATFKMQSPVWITFLWAAMATPKLRPLFERTLTLDSFSFDDADSREVQETA